MKATLLASFLFFPSLHALDNGLALTPPMGWLSWERFGCNLDCEKHPDSCISERLYLQQAQQLVLEGYRDAGYVFVNIDDCWSEKERDENGDIVEDRKRFPSGIKNLSSELHKLGLKLGLYGDIGVKTCAGYPGYEGHFEQDAKKLAEWEVDSIKVDNCNADPSTFNVTYPAFGKALNETGRPILYMCEWPYADKASNHGENPDLLTTIVSKTCNQWRNYYDVFDDWSSVRSIIDFWSRPSPDNVLVRAGGPGHWNDPDMLVVGNPGLSISEQQAQFSLWAIFAAPLMISADLKSMPQESKKILLNQEIIAISQDPMGRQGWCAEGAYTDTRVYVRELLPSTGEPCLRGESDRWAVVLANFLAIFKERPVTFDPKRHLPNGDSWDAYIVKDVISHSDLSRLVGPLTVDIDESSVRMFVVTRLHDGKTNNSLWSYR